MPAPRQLVAEVRNMADHAARIRKIVGRNQCDLQGVPRFDDPDAFTHQRMFVAGFGRKTFCLRFRRYLSLLAGYSAFLPLLLTAATPLFSAANSSTILRASSSRCCTGGDFMK